MPSCIRRSASLANDYGFKSWRTLKAHLDAVNPRFPTSTIAFSRQPAPATSRLSAALLRWVLIPLAPMRDGRTIHQVAKDRAASRPLSCLPAMSKGRSARPEQRQGRCKTSSARRRPVIVERCGAGSMLTRR